MAVDLKLDGDAIWTQKPTHIVCRGVAPGLQLPQCPHGRRLANRSEGCPYQFLEGSGQEGQHLQSTRIDTRSALGQTRQEEHMRHAIPLGLIDKLHKAHAQHQAKEFNSQARKLILACRECGGRAETSHVHPVQTRAAAQASAAASAPDQPAPTQPNPTEQDHCAKHRRKTPAGPHQGATVPNSKEGQECHLRGASHAKQGSQAASAVAVLTREVWACVHEANLSARGVAECNQAHRPLMPHVQCNRTIGRCSR